MDTSPSARGITFLAGFSTPFRLLNLIFPIGSKASFALDIYLSIPTYDKPGVTTSPTPASLARRIHIHTSDGKSRARLLSGARYINSPASSGGSGEIFENFDRQSRHASLILRMVEVRPPHSPLSFVFLIIFPGIRQRIRVRARQGAALHRFRTTARADAYIGIRLVQSISEVARATQSPSFVFVRRTSRTADRVASKRRAFVVYVVERNDRPRNHSRAFASMFRRFIK